MTTALSSDLPFKIPYRREVVNQYSNVFEIGRSTIDDLLGGYFRLTTLGQSEMTTTSKVSRWLDILVHTVSGVNVLQDQHDQSSVGLKRPDATVEVNGCVALKIENKYLSSDLDPKELTDKLHPDAVRVFPMGNTSIIGFTCSTDMINIYIIDHSDRQFRALPYRSFNMTTMTGKVDFLVILFKIMRWMSAIIGPNSFYHLKPDVRLVTPNRHHVTWIKDGLLKEYNHKSRMRQALERISVVYSRTPRLVHVESGRVVSINPPICLITRLGYKLSRSSISSAHLSIDEVKRQVQEGLDELHALGYAHCDLSVNNVFIDDNGIVFLDDLEYLTPIDELPININPARLPYGTDVASVTSALRLDELQFQQFSVEILRV